MNRRRFLTSACASAASIPFLRPSLLFARANKSPFITNIGLQLWTVRNQMANDTAETLKAVADAGYKQVELMRVLGDADNILPVANDHGMNVTSAFIDWQSVGNPHGDNVPSFDKILEKAEAKNLKFLVFGYIGKGHRETSDQFKNHAEAANKAGEKCKKAGIQLCYHNHSFEFKPIGSTTGWDILVQEFDDELVKFELDVFWVKVGGFDPVATMKKLDGRIAQLHLKDIQKGTGTIFDEGKVPHEAFQELGDGTIDMKAIMELGEKIGVTQCHVEQDQSPNPIASIGQSMNHLIEQG